jgi:uncharacterized protein YecE (DUF72 family)
MSPSTSPTLRCGVAGWSYPHWDRVIYPYPKPQGFHPLAFLPHFFDVLEINTSFYQPLRPEVSRLWVQKVDRRPNFRFTAKLHQRFTHDRVLDNDDVEAFAEGLRPLAESRRLGCLLMQFPWSFRFTPENREYFIKLRRAFHAFPLVAEMRHASWSSEEALGTFIDYHVGFANIDQPDHIKAMPPTAFLTSSVGYVRLHGRNKENWWKEYSKTSPQPVRNDYTYSTAELSEWQQRIERIRNFASELYVIANNDAAGKAVITALQLQSMLDGRKHVVPQQWHDHFADQLSACVERPKQESLFASLAPRRAVA